MLALLETGDHLYLLIPKTVLKLTRLNVWVLAHLIRYLDFLEIRMQVCSWRARARVRVRACVCVFLAQ